MNFIENWLISQLAERNLVHRYFCIESFLGSYKKSTKSLTIFLKKYFSSEQ